MKITHIISTLQIGGAERFVIDLSELQKKENLDVKILSFGKPSDPLVQVCLTKQIPVVLIRSGILKRSFDIYNELKNTDIIHVHSPYALRTALLALLILSYKKIIYTRHGEGVFSNFHWTSLHKIAQIAINHITFVSNKGKTVFQKVQQLSNIPHHVIENGVKTRNIEVEINTKVNKLRIGSVGRMVELKNQISLLKSVQQLSENNRSKLEIHFFGDGECLEKLKTYTENYKLGDIVTFHGMITDRHYIYNHFDILIVTSETEGLSLAIIEAMMYSKPVIATDVGGNPRLVIDDKTGYLFDYNDNMALKNLIFKFIDNDKILNQIGNNAKKHVEDNFSLENTAKKYFKLYKAKSV